MTQIPFERSPQAGHEAYFTGQAHKVVNAAEALLTQPTVEQRAQRTFTELWERALDHEQRPDVRPFDGYRSTVVHHDSTGEPVEVTLHRERSRQDLPTLNVPDQINLRYQDGRPQAAFRTYQSGTSSAVCHESTFTFGPAIKTAAEIHSGMWGKGGVFIEAGSRSIQPYVTPEEAVTQLEVVAHGPKPEQQVRGRRITRALGSLSKKLMSTVFDRSEPH